MTRIKIPLVGGNYKHTSLPFSTEETINMFTERGTAQTKSPAILRRFPGLKLWTTITGGAGAIRGMYETSNKRLFIVRGNTLLEVDSSKTETTIGTLDTNTGRVVMTDNGFELVVSDGTDLYKYTFATSVFATVTDSNGVNPDNTPMVDFAEGYIFGFDPDASNLGEFRHSPLRAIDDWLAIDVYNAESSPDALVALRVLNGEVWAFGSKSYEVFYNARGDNSTTSNPTWAAIGGSAQNIGCGAKHSVASIRGKIFWLGASKDGEHIVWTNQGYQPQRVSNRAIESEIAEFTSTDDAWAFTYEYEGHYFYVLTFQTGNKTFVYDLIENEWLTWAYRDTSTGDQERQRVIDHAFTFGKNLVGDYANGNIYELDKETYTDNSQPIVWERYFPYFEHMKQRISWYSLEIDILTGTALLAGQGSDPKIQIRWSDNGGRSYGNWHQMTLGLRGKYDTRVIKRLLGQSRDRVYHIRSSEPIPISIQDDTVAEIEASDS